MEKEVLLNIKDLNLFFKTKKGKLHALKDVSFELQRGEMLGVVGESGSGKSITNLAIMGLLPNYAQVNAKSFHFQETELLNAKPKLLLTIRGKKIAMIFQDAMSSLNPILTVEFQIDEVLKLHSSLDKDQRRDKIIAVLNQVGIPDPETRLKSYPFELSGGMAQRVMIAMAIVTGPDLLIADEPTTALDVTIQKQILDLLKKIQREEKMTIMLITHDLSVVAQYADRIQVMYAGEIIESGLTDDVINRPYHPYTEGLLSSLPERNESHQGRLNSIPGTVPSLFERTSGCQFANRCEYAKNICKESVEINMKQNHLYRCHFPVNQEVLH